MKKILFSTLFLGTFFIANSTTNRVSATEVKDVSEIFKYEKFLNKDFSSLKEKEFIGTKFYNGTIGHRQKIKFGDINLTCLETEKITDNYGVGTLKNLTFEKDFTYSTTNEYTLSVQTNIGIKDIASQALKFEDIGSFGNNFELTTSYELGVSTRYGVNIQKNYTIDGAYDLTEIPSDKLTFRVSKVSCFLEAKITESYEEKEWWWNWWRIDGTTKTNYYIYYYIDDLITFVYNDDTFGTNSMGLYKLQTIKSY